MKRLINFLKRFFPETYALIYNDGGSDGYEQGYAKGFEHGFNDAVNGYPDKYTRFDQALEIIRNDGNDNLPTQM